MFRLYYTCSDYKSLFLPFVEQHYEKFNFDSQVTKLEIVPNTEKEKFVLSLKNGNESSKSLLNWKIFLKEINDISNDSFNYISKNTSIENIIPDIINQNIESSNQNIRISNQNLESPNQNIESSIDINMYGKPYDYAVNKFIHWEFYDPKPWTKIIYNYGDEYPFYFYIKARIPSLNDYQNWKNIMHNLNFDPRSGELIIPSTDEETALSISNLIISNLKGDITLEEIINKDLIAISVVKCRKYEVVKNKIREQLIQNITHSKLDLNKINKPIEIVHNKKNNNIDDIRTNNYFYYNQERSGEVNDFGAYDGNEFSFV
jgi:ASC-1-like (ASCH) protein